MFMVLNMMIGLMMKLNYLNGDDIKEEKGNPVYKFLRMLVFKNFFCEHFDYVFNFEYDDRG